MFPLIALAAQNIAHVAWTPQAAEASIKQSQDAKKVLRQRRVMRTRSGDGERREREDWKEKAEGGVGEVGGGGVGKETEASKQKAVEGRERVSCGVGLTTRGRFLVGRRTQHTRRRCASGAKR